MDSHGRGRSPEKRKVGSSTLPLTTSSEALSGDRLPRRGAKRGAKKRVTLPDVTSTASRRRGHGEDAIYFDAAKNRYVGAISVGFGPGGKRVRRKVSGRTKAEVRDKLKAAHAELDRGLHTSPTYTVQQATDEWLGGGLPGRSDRTRSIYREALKPLLEHIGTRPLRELTARDVRRGLEALSETMSTRYLQLAKASLARAIRYAEAHDLVGRNVATLVDSPKGQVGRPSRSFTLEQSLALLDAVCESRLNAYVVLSLGTGIRTEEARELRWDHVDLDGDPNHRDGWSRCRMGAAGPAPHLRLPDVGRRRAHRGDRSPGWPQPHRNDRARLPSRTAPGYNDGAEVMDRILSAVYGQ